jgi:hypothetical protein
MKEINSDVYEALKRSGRSEGVINPGDQAFYGVSRLMGIGISEDDANELRKIIRS